MYLYTKAYLIYFDPMQNILLTGATGFLGREILFRLLMLQKDKHFILVIRGDKATAEARIKKLFQESLDTYQDFLSRIEIISGDITLSNFGLGYQSFCELSTRIESIIHCAASTDLTQEELAAYQTNVLGTANVLELAKLASSKIGKRFSFHHISTAFVAGDTKGIVKAETLNLNSPFRNFYEKSKAISESLVRNLKDEMRVVIYRPSIIVGDSKTGRTTSFNVIYIPAKLLTKGFFSHFPACPSTRFDIVPVDYVADAISYLSTTPIESGSCFHLTAGMNRETTVWEIIETLFDTLNKHLDKKGNSLLPTPPFLPSELLSLIQHSLQNSISVAKFSVKTFEKLEKIISSKISILRNTLPFIPYMTHNPQFDNQETISSLNKVLDPSPLFKDYAEKIFSFCLETNWGKKPWENTLNLPILNSGLQQLNPLVIAS